MACARCLSVSSLLLLPDTHHGLSWCASEAPPVCPPPCPCPWGGLCCWWLGCWPQGGEEAPLSGLEGEEGVRGDGTCEAC